MMRLRMVRRPDGGDAVIFLITLVVTLASFLSDDPEAFFFPRLLAVSLVALCALRLGLMFRPSPPAAPTPAGELRLAAPALALIAVYLLAADVAGFYGSSGLIFFLLSGAYAQNRWRGILKRAVLSLIVVAALYVVFAKVMGVQTPEGILL